MLNPQKDYDDIILARHIFGALSWKKLEILRSGKQ